MSGRDPVEDFEIITRELDLFPGRDAAGERLADKPQLVTANKIDALDEPARLERLKDHLRERGIPLYAVSAVTGEGIDALLEAIWREVTRMARAARDPRHHDELAATTPLGILGGTLDPVHVGHVETALAARAALALDRVLLLPSRVPPHRPLQPSASPFHRFAMAALAVNGWKASRPATSSCPPPAHRTRHRRSNASTQSGVRPWQIFFILGADAFAEIETWNRYPRVLDLANFVVVSRPGYDSRGIVESLPALARRFASTASAAASGATDTRIFVLPAVTPDVSSTEIRRRLLAFEPVVGLIGEAVERHIRQHRLYHGTLTPMGPQL